MHTLITDHQRSLPTRASLLFKLRDWDDRISWDEFYRLYRKLIYNLARRAGLSHSESEDVTQDVFKRVAQTIKDFNPGPQPGSFRSWLMNQTRWRIVDLIRHRIPGQLQTPAPDFGAKPARTTTLERVPAAGPPCDSSWDEDWQYNVLELAITRLSQRVPARYFQAFELYARQRWPARRVARELGLSVATVYLVSHRFTKKLKREAARLQAQLG